MSKISREVLKAFRKLHRTRQFVFAGDDKALEAGRNEINANFKKNMMETDAHNIKKMLQLAWDVDKELRTNVIQARLKENGNFELRITKETTLLDNKMFNPEAVIEPPRRRGKAGSAAEGGCVGGGAAVTDTKSAYKVPGNQK